MMGKKGAYIIRITLCHRIAAAAAAQYNNFQASPYNVACGMRVFCHDRKCVESVLASAERYESVLFPLLLLW